VRLSLGAVLLQLLVVFGLGTSDAAATGSTALLAEYQPVTLLYRSDWKPVTVETLLAHADLERRDRSGWKLVAHGPSPRGLPAAQPGYRLDIRGCSPATDTDACYRNRSASSPAVATVYGRVWHNPDANARIQTVLQYWFFYYLDDWRNSLTRPTLWQIHEGDWETALVALVTHDRPLAVAYSQHLGGVVRPWAAVPRRGGTHPLDYVALGSHANYFTIGRHGRPGVPHQIPPGLGAPIPEPDFTTNQIAYGPTGDATHPAHVVDISTGAPWLGFAGAWGDGSYLLIHNPSSPRSATAHLRTVDSPQGPAYHDFWRNPLQPFVSWPRDDGH
jgi:hypothetical protein